MATEFTLVTANNILFCWFTYKNVTVTRAVNDPAFIAIGLPLKQKL